jgi:opacity protein-like surface antigen
MGRAKALLFMGFIAAAVGVAPARAADILPEAPPLDEPSLRGALADDSGFTLRVDAGVAITNATKLRSTYGDGATLASLGVIEGPVSIGDPFLLGLGVGYQFNPWLRADLTAEYRQSVQYHASSETQFVGAAFCPTGGTIYCGNDATAAAKTGLFLANGYIDLGDWGGVTPYVGAGVGVAAYQISAMKDKALYSADAFSFAPNASGSNFAWSLTAGASYHLSANLVLDLSYRYVNMGRFKTGAIACNALDPGGCHFESQHFDMTSNDLRIGLRWLLFDPDLPPVAQARY